MRVRGREKRRTSLESFESEKQELEWKVKEKE